MVIKWVRAVCERCGVSITSPAIFMPRRHGGYIGGTEETDCGGILKIMEYEYRNVLRREAEQETERILSA